MSSPTIPTFQPYDYSQPTPQPQQQPQEKGWGDWAIEMGLQTIPAVAGSAIGSLAGPIGTIGGGAVGAGLGESLREWYAGEDQNPWNIGVQGVVGAIPFAGKMPGVGATAADLAKYAVRAPISHGLQGAALGAAATIPTSYANTGRAPSFSTIEEGALGGGLFGAAGGLLTGTLPSKMRMRGMPEVAQAEVPPPPIPLSGATQFTNTVDDMAPPSAKTVPPPPATESGIPGVRFEADGKATLSGQADAGSREMLRKSGYAPDPSLRSPEGLPQWVKTDPNAAPPAEDLSNTAFSQYMRAKAEREAAGQTSPPTGEQIPSSWTPFHEDDGFIAKKDKMNDVSIRNLEGQGYELVGLTPEGDGIFKKIEGFEDPTVSAAGAPRGYQDTTPERYKRYNVYDENDNLIHKTYDYDEAHKLADRENGYVNDTGEQPNGISEMGAADDPNHPHYNTPAMKAWRAAGGNPDPDVAAAQAHKQTHVDDVNAVDDETWIRMEVGDREEMLRAQQGKYAEHGARVANKELLQNAIDATPQGGKINVDLDFTRDANNVRNGGTITVSDRGKGLSLDLIQNEYVKLTGSGKRGKIDPLTGRKPIGEMGEGKATYLLGADKFEVTTITKENDGNYWQYEFGGTSEQMITGRIQVHKQNLGPATRETGTVVRVHDSSYENMKAAEKYLKEFADYSASPAEVHIKGNSHSFMNATDKVVMPSVHVPGQVVGSITAPGTNVHISVPTTAQWKEGAGSGYINGIITNRGMFQGVEPIWVGSNGNLPDRLLLDFDPTVPASDAKLYPLTSPTRERMKDPVRRAIEREFADKVVAQVQANQVNDLKQAYQDLVPAPNARTGQPLAFVTHNSGGRYTPAELAAFNNSPRVQAVAGVMNKVLDELNQLMPRYGKLTGKFGFMLDDGTKGGLNVPDPGSVSAGAKNAILVNLFSAAENAPDPNAAAQRLLHIIIHEFTHNIAREEGAGFTWAMAQVHGVYDLEKQLNAKQAILSAISGPGGGYAPEFQSLLQQHTTARGRADVTPDLIRRSAEGRFAEAPGQGGIPNSSEPNGARTTGQEHPIVQKLRDGLVPVTDMKWGRFITPDGEVLGMKDQLRDTHYAIAKELGLNIDDIKQSGVVRIRRDSAEANGPITRAQARAIIDAQIMQGNQEVFLDVYGPDGASFSKSFHSGHMTADSVMKWVNHHFEGGPVNETYRNPQFAEAPPTQAPPTQAGMGGTTPPMSPSTAAAPTGGGANPPIVVPKTGKAKKPPSVFREMYNFARGVTTTGDLSAPLRQGMPMMFSKKFWTSFKQMTESLGSEGAFQKTIEDLKARPLFQNHFNEELQRVEKSFAEKVGMKLSDLGTNLTNREEALASNWVEKGGFLGSDVPGIKRETMLQKGYQAVPGRYARATNRAYTAYLNQLRADSFESLLMDAYKDFKSGGKGARNPFTDLKYAREIADYVNTATGRGPLKIARPTLTGGPGWKESSFEQHAKLFTDLVFSPRLMASRMRMLNPATYMMASPFIRKQYIKSAISTATMWGGTVGLAALAGAEVSNDPNSADFWKIRIGNTRIDPAAGFQQYAVALSRLISGHTTSSSTGSDFELGQGFRAQTRGDVIHGFAANKLHPVVKFAHDLAFASKYQPFQVEDRLAQMFVPLIVGDIMDLVKEDPKLLPFVVPVGLGMGTQTYGKGEAISKFIPKEKDFSFTGGQLY